MSFVGQAFHVFRKDLRRFWPGLLGVAVLMGVHRTVGLDVPGTLSIPGTGVLPVQVFPILFALFTVVVVQDDAVHTGRSFLRGSPMRMGAILLGKAAFIGLFLWALPIAAHVQWLASLGGAAPTWGLALDSGIHHGGLLALVALGASLTPNLTSFLGLAVAAWVGGEFVQWLLPTESFWVERPYELTRSYLLRVGWALVGASLLIHQYLTGRTIRSAGMAAAFLIALLVALPLIRIQLGPDPLTPEARVPFAGADEIDFRLLSIRHEEQGGFGQPLNRRGMISAAYQVIGLDSVDVYSDEVTATLTGRSDTWTFSVGPHEFPGMRNRPRPLPPPEGATPLGQFANQYPPMGRIGVIQVGLAVGDPESLKPLREARRFDTSVRFDVFGTRVATAIPPEVGASGSVAGVTAEVLDVRRARRSLAVTVRLYGAQRAMWTENFTSSAGATGLWNIERSEYMPFGQPIPDRSREDSAAPSHYFVGGSSFYDRTTRFAFDLTRADPRDGPPIPADWLDNTTLFWVEPAYLGSLTRTLGHEVDEWPSPGGEIQVNPFLRGSR